jgi:hypothetical protein
MLSPTVRSDLPQFLIPNRFDPRRGHLKHPRAWLARITRNYLFALFVGLARPCSKIDGVGAGCLFFLFNVLLVVQTGSHVQSSRDV